MFRCEKRNNEIYITFSDYDFFNPIILTNFWKVKNVDADLFPDNFIPEKFNNIFTYKIHDKIIPLYISDFPDFTEQIPVKLKKSEKWHNGRIVKK